jgi:hypothetical protein
MPRLHPTRSFGMGFTSVWYFLLLRDLVSADSWTRHDAGINSLWQVWRGGGGGVSLELAIVVQYLQEAGRDGCCITGVGSAK